MANDNDRFAAIVGKLKELADDQYREPSGRFSVDDLSEIADDAIAELGLAQRQYADLWCVVSVWCDLQAKHPGCLPDVRALREALDKRMPAGMERE